MPCKNCERPLDSSSNYCAYCGAKIIRKRLTFKNLLAHFSEQFFNYDNKFLQTLIDLIKKPEFVINGYISGVRKKYVNPISYFAIAITIVGLQMFVISKFFPESLDVSALSVGGNEEQTNAFLNNIMEYQSILFMINIPLYAFISWIVFLTSKKYNYTEHLVLFLYTVAQTTFILFVPQLVLVVLGKTLGDISPILLILQILYTSFCYKRVFNLSTKGIILRSLLFLVVMAISFVIFSILFALISIQIYGGVEEFINAQKAIQ